MARSSLPRLPYHKLPDIFADIRHHVTDRVGRMEMAQGYLGFAYEPMEEGAFVAQVDAVAIRKAGQALLAQYQGGHPKLTGLLRAWTRTSGQVIEAQVRLGSNAFEPTSIIRLVSGTRRLQPTVQVEVGETTATFGVGVTLKREQAGSGVFQSEASVTWDSQDLTHIARGNLGAVAPHRHPAPFIGGVAACGTVLETLHVTNDLIKRIPLTY